MSLFRATTGNSIRISGGVAKIRVGTPKVLYYNAAFDTTWSSLGNWWLDSTHTQPATHLPRSIDSAVVTGNIQVNGETVVDFTLNDPDEIGNQILGTLTVTGNAVFNGYSSSFDASTIIIGNVTFNGYSINNGTVTGNATFNDISNNFGTVGGNAIFNLASSNESIVTGNATFNDFSYNFATITGDATFNGASFNDGIILGNATFNDGSENYYGTVEGNATFNDGSRNGNEDSSGFSPAIVSGNAVFNGGSRNDVSGLVSGNATFNDDSYNLGTVEGFITCNTTNPNCP